MPSIRKCAEMSYDEYDALCETVAELDIVGTEWVPTMEDIKEIQKENDITPWIAAIVRVLEVPPKNVDREVLRALNKLLLDKINFTEEPTPAVDQKEVTEFSYDLYRKEYRMIERSNANYGRWTFQETFVSDVMQKNPVIWHFFGLVVLFKNTKSVKADDKRALKAFLKKRFKLTSGGKTVLLSQKDYMELETEMKNFKIERGRWWPEPQEVDVLMRPNIDKCYDFLIWLLAQEPGPFTKEERDSERALQKLFDEEVAIKGGSDIVWL